MPFLLIALPAALLGFLEARVLHAPAPVELAGIGWGLLWTALAGAMLLAPGVVLHLMYGLPADYLAVQQPPAGAGTVGYYALFNPLTEWVLMPLALHLGRLPASVGGGAGSG